MPTITISVLDETANTVAKGKALGLLVPQAITTAHQRFEELNISDGGQALSVTEKTSGQDAVLLTPTSALPTLNYTFTETAIPDTPEDYASFENRYTRASSQLNGMIAGLIDGNTAQTVQRIVSHTATLFDYGHPEQRFNDGFDDVPVIACGTAKGSCVDINTYLISALHSAGIPNVYFAGYFFPEERGGLTNDMHCWVATWFDGAWWEWDIAHHMKMGLSANDIRPAYNPKPGQRFAITYGRGLAFGIKGTDVVLSHLSEPRWVFADGQTQTATIEARLSP